MFNSSAKRLLWRFDRLRAMSWKEIVAMRLYRLLRDRLRPVPRPKVPCLSFEPEKFDRSLLDVFEKRFAGSIEKTISTADQLLENRVSLFGRKIVFDEIDWNRDYLTKRSWPLVPACKLDYRGLAAGDPKNVWELNRHQFLPTLAKAYWFTRDEKYAEKLIALVVSWIEQCPPFHGINWTSGIELSLRQLSWVWSFKWIAGSASWEQKTKDKIVESMYLQTQKIAENLSLYSSVNNHLIAELMALVVIGRFLGQKNWIEQGADMLAAFIDSQVLPDGSGAEMSTSYHLHTLEMCALSFLELSKERSVDLSVLQRLKKGAEYVNMLLSVSDQLPAIGDSDSGRILQLAEGGNETASLLNLAAYLTDDASLYYRPQADEKLFWLLEDLGERHDFPTDRRTAEVRRAFESGGVYLLEKKFEDRRLSVLFDCGPLGLKPLAGHSHADALAILVYWDGVPVFIDPGTYTYFKSRRWRDYFRSTLAHNTIRVDRQDQSLYGGLFMATRQAESSCLIWREGREVSGRHDGYLRLKSPLGHIRRVSFQERPAGLCIEDKLECDGRHEVEIMFHCDPRCEVYLQENNEVSIKTKAGNFRLRLDRRFETSLYRGDTNLPLGWFSDCYDNRIETTTILGRCRIDGETNLVSVLDLGGE
jgi:hypothetical protein